MFSITNHSFGYKHCHQSIQKSIQDLSERQRIEKLENYFDTCVSEKARAYMSLVMGAVIIGAIAAVVFTTSYVGLAALYSGLGFVYTGRLGYDMHKVLVHEKVLSDLLQKQGIRAVYQIPMLGFASYETHYQQVN
jgi:hypothetical protein